MLGTARTGCGAGVGARLVNVLSRAGRVRGVSGELMDALVRVGQYAGGGPGVDDADDRSPASSNESSWCVEQGPAQPFRTGVSLGVGETDELEPTHQIRCESNGLKPRLVRVEVAEREPAQP